jgi:quercetin dioxygenase-like cupin family protein
VSQFSQRKGYFFKNLHLLPPWATGGDRLQNGTGASMMGIVSHDKLETFQYSGIFHQTLVAGPESRECSLWLDTFSPGAEMPSHRCASEQVVTILSGQGEAVINGRKYELAADMTILVQPNIVRSFKAKTSMRLIAFFPDPDPRILDPRGKEIELPWAHLAAAR